MNKQRIRRSHAVNERKELNEEYNANNTLRMTRLNIHYNVRR
jgi:hypothetical protein